MEHTPERISELITLNETIQEHLQTLLDSYPNTHFQRYEGSALISLARFEEHEEYENAGMIMFVSNYLPDSNNILFTSHMEINYRTLNDKQDRLLVSANDVSEEEVKNFVEQKTDEFLTLYQDPPSLWEGKL